VVPIVSNLINNSRVLDKGASVLKIQALLLQVKLPSTLYCLEQLAEFLGIRKSVTKYIVNFDESN
jgi:hypothetical protein